MFFLMFTTIQQLETYNEWISMQIHDNITFSLVFDSKREKVEKNRAYYKYITHILFLYLYKNKYISCRRVICFIAKN